MTDLTLTATNDESPAPYVEVTVDDIDDGVSSVTVWRTAGGRSFKVRGLVKVSAGGTVNARDFEAPRGVESSYRVEQFDSSGDFVSWSDAVTVTLAVEDSNVVWVHNPFDPDTSVSVRLLQPAAGELVRPVNAEVFRPLGRSVGVAIFGAREGLRRVQLDCYLDSTTNADKFDALFGGYDDTATVPILCIRGIPAMRLPGTLFALVAEPTQIPLNYHVGGEATEFRLVGDEVAPPAEAVVVALLSYADFTAFYDSYDEFTAAYASYREAQLDYSIAGTE